MKRNRFFMFNESESKNKIFNNLTLVICFLGTLLLSSCGSSTNTTLKAPNVQISKLAYGVPIAFYVGVTQLNQGISLNATLCGTLTQIQSPSPLYLAYSCTTTGTGNMVLTAKDANGNVILTQSFAIPDPQVTMVTNLGTVVFDLNPNAAPNTVQNFLQYVSSGFYSNLIFHRVIPGFVVQSGGFTSGMNPVTPTYPAIALETPNGLSNTLGTLVMARTSDPNSATSQFFVNLADNSSSLDYQNNSNPGYAVFGYVSSGKDVINQISAVQTKSLGSYENVPVTDVTITSMTRTQ